jgi:hypothetical protein
MELPGKGPASYGIAKQKAFVPHQIARVPRSTAAGEIRGCGTSEDAGLEKLARDQTGWLRLPEPHCNVKTFRHQIAQRVADQKLQ